MNYHHFQDSGEKPTLYLRRRSGESRIYQIALDRLTIGETDGDEKFNEACLIVVGWQDMRRERKIGVKRQKRAKKKVTL